MTRQRPRASNTPLAEGEHSIDRARSHPVKDADGRVIGRRLGWNILLPGDAKPTKRFTQSGPKSTETQLRAKARATATKMLEERQAGGASTWSLTSSLGEFCEAVVRPDLKAAARLTDRTRQAYLNSLDLMLGICTGKRHEGQTHTKSLGKKTITAATRILAIEDCLQEIARLHGHEVARRTRSVYTGWVVRHLRRHELISASPIKGERIDLTSMAKVHEGARNGETVAMSRTEYNRIVDHLVALDPAKGVTAPSRGRWTLEHKVAMRRNIIDLTIIQAGTGLRIAEARQAWRGLVRDGGDGMSIDVHESIAKGRHPRLAHVLDDRVVWRIREILLLHPEDADDVLLIGQVKDRTKVWDHSKVNDQARELYNQLAEELEIPRLAVRGRLTHIWRTTMNMQLLAAGIPSVARAQQLGHTEQVAADYYTTAMPTELAAEARALISG